MIVNFHGIGEPTRGVPDDEVPYWCPIDEWPRFADALAEVPSDGAVRLEITFDDGNLSDVTHALPALVDRGLQASFYVCAGRLGKSGYVGPDEVRELGVAGMGIGSHGWDHVDLRRTDDSALLRETVGSRERLAETVGAEVDQFAIPFGSYDRRVLRHLRGYREVFTSDGGRAPSSSWLTPRASYVRDWQPAEISRMVRERVSLGDRVGRRLKTLVKSMR
nr:polysaccharide deacetylase family protein [Tessaracoccus sp. OS52]